jgi:hypothetical protein
MCLIDFRAKFLPYCLQKVGKDSYVVLNRGYKLIGFNKNDFLLGDQLKEQNTMNFDLNIKIDDELAERISTSHLKEEGLIFLYDDASIPTSHEYRMIEYLEAIKEISNLS